MDDNKARSLQDFAGDTSFSLGHAETLLQMTIHKTAEAFDACDIDTPKRAEVSGYMARSALREIRSLLFALQDAVRPIRKDIDQLEKERCF